MIRNIVNVIIIIHIKNINIISITIMIIINMSVIRNVELLLLLQL